MAQWGKLYGVAKKSGIQVFERFEGTKRILTSVKNNNVIKTVEKEVEEFVGIGKYVSAASKIRKQTTHVYDANKNIIRYIYKDVEICPEKNYKNKYFVTWGSDYKDFKLSCGEEIKGNRRTFYTSLDDENTGFNIYGRKDSYYSEPSIRMKVRSYLRTGEKVDVTPGEYCCDVGKDGKLGVPDETEDIHINREGAQSLFNEFKNYFKFMFK